MRLSRFVTFAFIAIGVALSITGLVYAQAGAKEVSESGYKMIGAGLAMGLAGLGTGLGMGTASAAAVAAIAEKPETFSKALIFIVFLEAIAIYGLVVAFMIMVF
jgi:V/A-type H+-transporting ATPase subunit K